MIINNVLSVPFYEFQCDEDLIDKIFSKAVDETFLTNLKNSITKENFYQESLYDWLDSCVEEVRKIYYTDTIKLKITNCWFNKSKKMELHHVHNHPSSIISGILYLTTHNSGETVFYQQNPWRQIGEKRIADISNRKFTDFYEDPAAIVSKVTPTKGKLILFPGSIRHGTRPNKESFPRYTLSFNTYFSGFLEWGDGNINQLHLNTVGIRDTVENKNKQD
jgi:uncharacterized protein (TIGR02466 family)